MEASGHELTAPGEAETPKDSLYPLSAGSKDISPSGYTEGVLFLEQRSLKADRKRQHLQAKLSRWEKILSGV